MGGDINETRLSCVEIFKCWIIGTWVHAIIGSMSERFNNKMFKKGTTLRADFWASSHKDFVSVSLG